MPTITIDPLNPPAFEIGDKAIYIMTGEVFTVQALKYGDGRLCWIKVSDPQTHGDWVSVHSFLNR